MVRATTMSMVSPNEASHSSSCLTACSSCVAHCFKNLPSSASPNRPSNMLWTPSNRMDVKNAALSRRQCWVSHIWSTASRIRISSRMSLGFIAAHMVARSSLYAVPSSPSISGEGANSEGPSRRSVRFSRTATLVRAAIAKTHCHPERPSARRRSLFVLTSLHRWRGLIKIEQCAWPRATTGRSKPQRGASCDPRLRAFLRRLLQSHARPSAILVDELDAGRFQASLDYVEGGTSRLMHPSLQLAYRYHPNFCFIGEFLLAPVE